MSNTAEGDMHAHVKTTHTHMPHTHTHTRQTPHTPPLFQGNYISIAAEETGTQFLAECLKPKIVA